MVIGKILEGDFLIMKKAHPCGSYAWKVLRTGADMKLKCSGCGRMIMLPRVDVAKRIKGVEKAEKQESFLAES